METIALLEPKRGGFLRAVLRQNVPVPADVVRIQSDGKALPSSRLRKLLFGIVALSPTLFWAGYVSLLASDQYVSTASFVVRTASKPLGTGGFGAILQMVGLSRSDDDVFSVQDYLRSREAIEKLSRATSLKEFYGHSGRDIMFRYPSFLYGDSNEEFYRYMQNFIDVSSNGSTGITNLTVRAFQPRDAYKIASYLLISAEEKVNDLNTRIRQDAIRVAENDVERSRVRLTDSMIALTDFRNQELMLDPNKNSLMLSELIGRLGANLSEVQMREKEMEMSIPGDPGLKELRDRASALTQQIDKERSKITTASAGLADKIAAYDRLMLDHNYAKMALDRSLNSLDGARAEARRQQLFLERIVNPNLPDAATMPRRIWSLTTIFALNLVASMIVWLMTTGLREHSPVED